MALIPVAELKPGQITASDIHNFHGQRLLAKGTALTPKLLTVLKSWGITNVDVQDVGTGSAGCNDAQSLPLEQLEKANLHVRSLFRHQDLEHPMIAEILRLAILRMARGGNPP